MNRKALMFANVRSGSARRIPQAVVLLQNAGIEVTAVRFDLEREAIAAAVDDAKRAGIGLVIACGGDGTVGSVVDAIVGKDVTLGVIAAGTSNNFARSLGITPSIRGSVAALSHGRETTIDVGEINGFYFAHAAIMGMNVEFARQAQRLRRVMGRFSYPVASLMVYRSRRRLAVRIENGARPREAQTYQLALLNSGSYGGALRLEEPGVGVRDHSLRVLTVHDLRLRTVLRSLPRIFFQRHLGLPGAESFDLETGRIVTRDPVPLTLDGEIRTQTPAEVRVVPNGLRVMALPRRRRS
jgi:diacylglycerol kinase (ATP)